MLSDRFLNRFPLVDTLKYQKSGIVSSCTDVSFTAVLRVDIQAKLEAKPSSAGVSCSKNI